MRNILLVSALSVGLTGCVNQFAKMPDKEIEMDPVSYAEQFVAGSEKGLINPYAFTQGREDGEIYNKYEKSWCGTLQYNFSQLENDLVSMCTAKGGAISGEWCSSIDNETPLFKMITTHSSYRKCSSGVSSHVQVIAPNDASVLGSNEWSSFAVSENFKVLAQIKYESELIEQETKRKDEQLKLKQLATMLNRQKEVDIMLSEIGTQVCKNGVQGIYTGYVEGFTDKKVKVRVVFYGGPGWSVPGFKETTVWGLPMDWYICE